MSVEKFFDEYWERQPLLLQRHSSEHYGALLRIEDIEQYLSRGDVRYPAVRLAKGGGFYPPEAYSQDIRYGDEVFRGVIDVEKLFTEYSSGASVTLPALHRAWPPLGRLCAQLEAQLDHSVHTNGYLTPANAAGFTPHYDTHEVFVLQVGGSKHWRVYPPPIAQPHRSQVFSPDAYKPPATALMEFTLTSGDLLYLPRGYVHTTFTSQSYSAHVTIGVTTYTWIELLSELVQSGITDPTLRSTLPPGFAHDPGQRALLQQRLGDLIGHLSSLDRDALIERFTQRVRAARTRAPAQFTADVGVVGPDSTLRVNAQREFSLSPEQTDLVLILEGRRIRLQLAVRPTLEAMCAAQSFTAKTLSSNISLDARMSLIRYLHGLGFLQLL